MIPLTNIQQLERMKAALSEAHVSHHIILCWVLGAEYAQLIVWRTKAGYTWDKLAAITDCDCAGSHVVMIGSYAKWHLGSEQYRWLERDLAAVNRSRTPWLVAAFHTPW